MITAKDERDYAMTGNLLDAFGCNDRLRGFYDFVELVYRIRLKIRENPQKESTTADIVEEMCKERRQPRRGFYGNIRRAIKPLLDADEDFFISLGGKMPEKMTVGALAKYLARIFESEGGS